MKFIKTLVPVAIATLAFSGCTNTSNSTGNGNSAAWQEGYDSQRLISAPPIEGVSEAYAYCTTFQENTFSSDDAIEITEYIDGCIEYVNGDGASESGSEDHGSNQAANDEVDLLALLNDGYSSTWTLDKFGPSGTKPNGLEAVYLGNSPDDESNCGVWVYKSVSLARSSVKKNAFAWVDGLYWWGEDSSGKGVVLIANSNNDACAVDASTVLNWNLNE